MAERLEQSPLLAGDAIDIAFSIGHNDHPDFGGLELSLRDFKSIGWPMETDRRFGKLLCTSH